MLFWICSHLLVLFKNWFSNKLSVHSKNQVIFVNKCKYWGLYSFSDLAACAHICWLLTAVGLKKNTESNSTLLCFLVETPLLWNSFKGFINFYWSMSKNTELEQTFKFFIRLCKNVIQKLYKLRCICTI